jgi:hypothetical protein
MTMSRPKTYELDEHDLGAHSKHMFRLYGGERVWLSDIRGTGEDAEVSLEFANVTIAGRLATIAAFGQLLATLLIDAHETPEKWEDLPGHRRRAGRPGSALDSQFEGYVPVPPRPAS